jgi:phosphonate transport system ATP-binding protein
VIQEIYGDDTETAVDENLTSTMAGTSPAGRQMEAAH